MPVRYMYVLDGEYGAKVIRYCTKTVTLTEAQMPKHNHGFVKPVATYGLGDGMAMFTQYGGDGWKGSDLNPNTTTDKGNNQAHTNLQPYVAIYMYRRTK